MLFNFLGWPYINLPVPDLAKLHFNMNANLNECDQICIVNLESIAGGKKIGNHE